MDHVCYMVPYHATQAIPSSVFGIANEVPWIHPANENGLSGSFSGVANEDLTLARNNGGLLRS